MKRFELIAAVALLAGCMGTERGTTSSSSESSSESERVTSELVGTWVAEVPGDLDCIYGLGFTEEGEYVDSIGCWLDEDLSGIDLVAGEFEIDDDALLFIPMKASCAEIESAEPRRLDFDLSGNTLTVGGSTGAIVYRRSAEDRYRTGLEGTGAALFGCIYDDGSFEPREVTSL